MKKNTLLLLLLGFSSYISAQCISNPGQYQYPFGAAFVPSICNGTTLNEIVSDGFAGEYSTVAVNAGTTYTFVSSVTTDVISLSTTTATESSFVLSYGIGSVTWYANFTGEVKFYTHFDLDCGEDLDGPNPPMRARSVICNPTPGCIPPTNLLLSNLTTNSISVSWTASSTLPANGYEYYVSDSNPPSNSTIATGTVGAGITTANITGLVSGTEYRLWVRSACSGSVKSNWSSLRIFTTLCTPVSTFSENFDADISFPSCWNRVGNGGATFVKPDENSFSVPNTLYIFGRNSTTTSIRGKAIVAMPAVSNAGAGTHRLRFKARGNLDLGGVLEVGYLTNPAEASSFVSLQSFTTTSNSTFDSFTATLGTNPGSSQVLAFRHNGTPDLSILIDDVSWEAIPTCVEPTNLTSPVSSLNSGTISWTASTSNPSNGYQYYYSTNNTSPNSATLASGSVGFGITSAIITSLNPQTTYFFWVRAVCSGSETSEWSLSGNFNTLCNVSSVPFTQDFESAIIPQMPLCSSALNVGTGNNWIVTNSPAASIGFNSKTLQYNYSTTNAANTWFFTNAISLTAGTNYTLSYKYGNNSVSSFSEKLRVAYGTVSSLPILTNQLADHPNVIGNTQLTNSVNFSPSVSGDYYFGFNAYSNANQFFLFVDDISITVNLENDNFNTSTFKVSPNPVKDILNIGYDKNISNVAVYNLLGQQVNVNNINSDLTQIDMSNLAKGTYIIKITSADLTQNIKVIKE